MHQRIVFLTACLLLLMSNQLWASPTGSIMGFVKGPSGAVVPGVTITLTNTATGVQLTTITNESGAYQFTQIPPATYFLVAEAAGFRKASITSVLVEVDQITRGDVTLEIGSVNEVIEVESVGTLLEADKSTLSSVVDTRTIANMPLNARQFLDLALLTPGVQPAGAGAVGGFAVAGARPQANNFQVDGISNMNTTNDVPLNNFRITDAVQEFAVQTSVALPEFGRGTGAQVNIVTKSGSNAFHGSAFEYFRNAHLDAADFFTNKLGGSKGTLNRNQFGSTLGGPIVTDRTFFFLSYEGLQQVAPQVNSTRVPTAAERATVTDPISRRLLEFWPAPNATGSLNYVGNVPSRASDNTGLVRIDHTFGKGDRLTGRWIEFQGATVAAGQTPLSGGQSDSPVSRSFVLAETHAFKPTFLNEIRLGYSRNQSATTAQDEGLNAATVFSDAAGKPLAGVVDGAKDPVHSGLPTILVAGGFASLGSVNSIPSGGTTNTYELFENMSMINPFGLSRHSWRWGFHIRREEARSLNESSTRGSFMLASFADFAAGLVDSAAFRTGTTLGYARRYPWDLFWQDQYKVKQNLTLNYGIRYEYPSVLAETRNHWTNFIPGIGPMVAGSNRILDIDPSKTGPASIFFRQAPFTLSSSGGIKPDKNNFAPVLGFAYSPRFARSVFGNDATVIRGGFRVGYDDTQNLLFGVMSRNPSYNLVTRQVANVTQPGRFPWGIGFNQDVPLISNFGRQGPGTPTAGVLTFFALDPNFRSAYIYQFSFGIQRRLKQEFSMELDYQGSPGHKLTAGGDINQPALIVRDTTKFGSVAPNEQIFPYNHFGGTSNVASIGNSNYHGMVATATYKGRRVAFFQASYTLSKSIDDGSASYNGATTDGGVADNNNRRLQRGPSSFDVRHRAVFVYVMELPVGPGHRLFGWKNGLNTQVLGGWQISGITTLQTGTPFTVITGGPDSSGFNSGQGASAGTNSDRPDVTRSGPLPQDNHNPDAAFDTTYFKVAPPGRAGTSGRNAYYGPGLQNYDFAAAKNFPLFAKLGEQTRLQFRADFFNLFNHTNFANPVRNMSSATFGHITQTLGTAVAGAGNANVSGGPLGGPRLIQFSLRLQY